MNEQQLRERLADRLYENGQLRSPQWRAAIEAVPRHVFIPEFFRSIDTPQGMMWEPVAPRTIGTDEWRMLAYENQTWVTQIDRHIHPSDTETPVPAGNPTSSSTLPGLVVAMLEDLDVNDDSKVMEIGTGTGYSTALLCERVGAENVVSIETDAGIAARAAQAIHQTGHKPMLITGNGLHGFPPRAPYDRIIATCSVRHIPAAWIAQSKPGATILTTLSGWQYGSGYARLTVDAYGSASGRFLSDTYSFMLARPHMPPSVDLGDMKAIDTSEPDRPSSTLTSFTTGPRNSSRSSRPPTPNALERAWMAARGSITTWTSARALSPPSHRKTTECPLSGKSVPSRSGAASRTR